MNTRDNRLPVTLLTGFLGAGKTTLLNQLIRDPAAGRMAVVMNEFGAVGLDHDLIEETTEETVLLDSGCLCCSIRGDLATTLADLNQRRKSGALDFDRVVIETTGIADPGPVMHTLVVSNLIAPDYRLDGVVTVADAATGSGTLDQQFEAVHQLAVADLIVLTKTDLISGAELAAYKARIDGINDTAPRIRASHGHVPPGQLFGLSAMRSDVDANEVAAWIGESGHTHANHDHDHHHDHAHDHSHHDHHHDHHHHDAGIRSASIELEMPISASTFDFWLDMLIALKGPDILRMKGIVHVEGMDWPFVFHGVQHIFDAPVPLKTWRGDGTKSKVVIIARNMSQEDLDASLNVLRLQPQDADAQAETILSQAVQTSL